MQCSASRAPKKVIYNDADYVGDRAVKFDIEPGRDYKIKYAYYGERPYIRARLTVTNHPGSDGSTHVFFKSSHAGLRLTFALDGQQRVKDVVETKAELSRPSCPTASFELLRMEALLLT